MFLSVQDHVSESTIKRILHKKNKKIKKSTDLQYENEWL
jgi:hypothetical protein